MADLYSLFWTRSHSVADECFVFDFGPAEEKEDDKRHYLNGRFCDDNGEYIELCDVPVPDAQWNLLSKVVSALSLPGYTVPDPYLLDAADSKIEITWLNGTEKAKLCCNGEYAHDLRHFIKTLSKELLNKSIREDKRHDHL